VPLVKHPITGETEEIDFLAGNTPTEHYRTAMMSFWILSQSPNHRGRDTQTNMIGSCISAVYPRKSALLCRASSNCSEMAFPS